MLALIIKSITPTNQNSLRSNKKAIHRAFYIALVLMDLIQWSSVVSKHSFSFSGSW
jgi:hypothetical protein